MSGLCKFILKISGWRVIGDMPHDIKKYVIIVAPHTSNWDFIIGVLVRCTLGFKSMYLGKKELFRPPFGWLFRKLGGYPVDRSKKANVTDQVVDYYNSHEAFAIAVAPEGTRKKVAKWRTGFYFIAYKAGVPIVPAVIDRKHKKVTIHPPFWPTGDLDADLPKLQACYQHLNKNKAAGGEHEK